MTVQDVYNTSYSIAHDYKPKGTIVDEPEYKKAPGHWNISYLSNHIDKVDSICVCNACINMCISKVVNHCMYTLCTYQL